MGFNGGYDRGGQDRNQMGRSRVSITLKTNLIMPRGRSLSFLIHT